MTPMTPMTRMSPQPAPRLVVIDVQGEQPTYTLYQGRQHVATFQADRALTPPQVEELRAMPIEVSRPEPQ